MPARTIAKAELSARPLASTHDSAAGLQTLDLAPKRHALLYVPPSAFDLPKAPLAVMLHGAGGNADQGLALLKEYAGDRKLILLAPESRKSSWDIISDAEYGPDVRFIDKSLEYVLSRYAIDPERIALGGFSDGASYGLSLGLSNGPLFRYILAFSPGFMAPLEIQDRPKVFISHGTGDDVLPIDPCSRRIVRALKEHQIPVRFREFTGGHIVPAEIKEEALELFLST